MLIIFLVVILCVAFVIVPLFMIQNKHYLKEMRELVENYYDYKDAHPENAQLAKRGLNRKLIAIKRKILLDKKAIEEANDIIDTVD